MDRSTLRTSTPTGTLSTTGAKLRMLVTPAATSRSHTPCAAAAGVAITPIDTLRCATTSSMASLLPTTWPAAISVPTTAAPASSPVALRGEGAQGRQLDGQAPNRRPGNALAARGCVRAARHSPVLLKFGAHRRPKGDPEPPQDQFHFTVRPCERMHKVSNRGRGHSP